MGGGGMGRKRKERSGEEGEEGEKEAGSKPTQRGKDASVLVCRTASIVLAFHHITEKC